MFEIFSYSAQQEADYLRKLMTKISMSDVLSKIQIREQIVLLPVRHMCYDLTLHLLPHRCYHSTTLETPKSVMKFIRYLLPEKLKRMFIKNLSDNFGGELISEQIKINREQNENINEDAVLVSVTSHNLLHICKHIVIIMVVNHRMKMNLKKLNLKQLMKLIQIVSLKLKNLILQL